MDSNGETGESSREEIFIKQDSVNTDAEFSPVVEKEKTEFDKKFEIFIESVISKNESLSDDFEKNPKTSKNLSNKDYMKFFLTFSWDFSKKFLPVSVVYLIYILINVTNILFVSHSEISKKNGDLLYSVNLGLSLYYMIGISISFGMSSALDTFCTNSYGAKLYYLMGCYRNRALVIMTLVYIPACVTLFFLKDILHSMGQKEEVAIQAGDFIRGILPGMLFFYWSDVNRRYMQAQGILIPTIFVVLVTSLIHPLWVYLLFNILELEALGIGLSCSITNLLNYILMLILLQKYVVQKESYFFINKDAFIGWKDFFALAIPSMLMMCLETWNYQIVNFLVGFLKNTVEENSNALLVNFSSIIYMFPFGISVAASNTIGEYIGDFATKKAEYSTKLTLLFTSCFSFIIVIILISLRPFIPYIFTTNPEEVSLMGNALWLYILYELFEIITTSYAGVYRGLGMQKIISFANFVCYYIICLPLTYFLTFTLDMKIYGVWTSYVISIICLIISYSVIHYFKVDFYKICKEANSRLSRDSIAISVNRENLDDMSMNTMNQSIISFIEDEKK